MMRSQLARQVVRRLRSAPQAMLPLRPATRPSLRRYPAGSRIARPLQRRTFLGLFQKAPRILKEMQVEPGYEALLEYGARRSDDLRPPPREQLIKGWRDFFRYKKFNKRSVNATQARVAHRVLRYLTDQADEGENQLRLSISDLRTAQDALRLRPRDDPTELVRFSKALFQEIRRMLSGGNHSYRPTKKGLVRTESASLANDTTALWRILTRHGHSIEARDQLLSDWPMFRSEPRLGYGQTKGLWVPVLRGLAEEGREKELLEFLQTLQEQSGLSFGRKIHEIMVTFYARQNNLDKMREWFDRPIQPDQTAPRSEVETQEEDPANLEPGDSVEFEDPEAATSLIVSPTYIAYDEVFRCALRNDDLDWAVSIYRGLTDGIEKLAQKNYTEEAVLLVYRFAVLLLGKGPEHIEQMMSHANLSFHPSMDIINTLVEAAMEKGDSYLAERMAALAPKHQLEPDNRLYSLQIDYRTRAGDLDGAFTAYRSLQNFESSEQDWPVLNRLIRALCDLPTPNHDQILEVTSYLEQLEATLEPETVVSLSMTFLKNDEQYEVIDTLSLHSTQLSIEERQLVSQAFVDYCLDSSNSTARVWDAYALLRQFFPDTTEPKDRVKIMDAFYDRKRADMASYVFGHMRQHSNTAFRPDIDAYIRCFEGMGRCPDPESLRTVHNMLKMDTRVQPNTQLYNALMIAHTACENTNKALDYWHDIDTSVDGPTYESLEIVFRTYELSPFGEESARNLWTKLHKMEIDVPLNVVTAYVGALASHSQLEDVKKILEEMEANFALRPDTMTYVSYNYSPD